MAKRKKEIEELIRSGIPMVERAARRSHRKLMSMTEFEDIRQIGVVALVEAANSFDPARKVPFEIWASRRIQGALVDNMGTLTGVRRAQVRSIVDFNKFEQASQTTHEQLKTSMRFFSLPNVQKCHTRNPSPVIHIVRGEKAEALIDLFGTSSVLQDPAKTSLDRERWKLALEALKAMPTEERTILTGHYLEGKTLSEIADARGVSRSWLSRLHQRALVTVQTLLMP